MRTLVLLRHAKSAWPPGVPDQLRPLNPRGRRDAPAAGRALAALGPIDLALVSPAARTGETFVAAAAELPQRPPMRADERIYQAGVGQLLAAIAEVPDEVGTLLVVGHNPGMEMLADYLVADDGSADYALMSLKFPTAGLAVIEVDRSWADLASAPAGTARLAGFSVPRG